MPFTSNRLGFWSQGNFSFDVTISSNTTNYNLKNAAIAEGWDQITPLAASITIDSGVVVSSTSSLVASIDTGLNFPERSTLIIINNGTIVGGGGNGGTGGIYTSGPNAGSPGNSGGVALRLGITTVLNNQGTIAGGGGGGGGGGNTGYMYPNYFLVTSGGGGGGGAGTVPGLGAPAGTVFGGTTQRVGGPGANGTNTTGGGGGARNGEPVWPAFSGVGGAGGLLGSAGSAGSPGTGGNTGNSSGGAGGAAGASISGNLFVTYTSVGTLIGPIV